MAHQLSALIAQYGLLLVFVAVLAEQIGAPVPALPVLVIAGALAATGQLPLAGIVLVALVACLIPDTGWYLAGRRFGARVMRTLCRVSLSRDSCIHKSEQHFERWGGWSLVIAKFVPGLSLIAPPLSGAAGLRPRAFALFDGLGSLLWIGVAAGLGYAFSGQIDQLLATLGSIGTHLLQLVLVLLALYIAVKWWWRRRLRSALQMARITVADLYQAMSDRRAPLIIDVRSRISRELDPRAIDGALLVDENGLLAAVRGVPLDREIVSYCNCPNEATSARAASILIKQGYRHARPLLGGLAAWEDAGYPTQRLQVDVGSGKPGSESNFG